MISEFSTNIIITFSSSAIEMVISFPASVPLILISIATFLFEVIGNFSFFSTLKSMLLMFLNFLSISFFRSNNTITIIKHNNNIIPIWNNQILKFDQEYVSITQ